MPVSKALFESHLLAMLGQLHGVARRLTRNDADAEDLVAESVVRAWKARESLAEEAAFRAWMFRILNNTFFSERRRLQARPQTEPFDEREDGNGRGGVAIFDRLHQPFLLWHGNPEQEFLNKLLGEDLDAALATLPEHYRVVIVLSDLEEFTYAEIAETLDIPVGTVRSRLSRARAALQQVLWDLARERGLRSAQPPAR